MDSNDSCMLLSGNRLATFTVWPYKDGEEGVFCTPIRYILETLVCLVTCTSRHWELTKVWNLPWIAVSGFCSLSSSSSSSSKSRIYHLMYDVLLSHKSKKQNKKMVVLKGAFSLQVASFLRMAEAGFYVCGGAQEPDLVRCYFCRCEALRHSGQEHSCTVHYCKIHTISV